MNQENLGPAERIIQTVLAYTDHAAHGRPGVVVTDLSSVTGVRWSPVTHKVEDGAKVVYRLDKVGNKTQKARVGVMLEPAANKRHEFPVVKIVENGRDVGVSLVETILKTELLKKPAWAA